MPFTKISQLQTIASAALSPTDSVPLVDASVPQTKRITISELDARYGGGGGGGGENIGIITLVAADSPYTLLQGSTQRQVAVSTAAGPVIIALPPIADALGRRYIFVKTSGDGNLLTLDGDTSETINGELTQVIEYQFTSLTLLALAGGWVIV